MREKGLGRVYAVLFILLWLIFLGSLLTGLIPVNVQHLLMGTLTDEEKTVLTVIRLPRFCYGALIGSALAASGAALQGVFGNPLADPGLLGISSGASLGAVLVLILNLAVLSPLMVPLGAFMGAALISFFVALLGRRSFKASVTYLLLGGVAVSFFCAALVSGLLSFAPAPIMQQYFFWTLGSLGTASLKAWPLAGLILVLLPGIFIWGRPLNLLSLGGEQAAALGLNVAFWRKLILFWTALLTSLAVCLGGNIGFVGLIVPHMGRFLSGADHHRLLPFAALIGAVFLTFCDLMGRWILPGSEIRTGIITALLGSPYFLYLLHQKKGA